MNFILPFFLWTDAPFIDINIFPRGNKDSCVLVYEIPASLLVFKKKDTLYSSNFEISYALYDVNKNQVQGDIKTVEWVLSLKDLEMDTLYSDKIVFFNTLEKGNFKIFLRSGGKEWKVEKNLHKEEKNGIQMSSLIFIHPEKYKEINIIKDLTEFILYFEIYSPMPFNDQFFVEINTGRENKKFPKKPVQGKGLIRIKDTILLKDIGTGTYTIEVQLLQNKISQKKELVVSGFSIMREKDFITLVEALYYFAPAKEVDSLKKSSALEREKLWEKFWKIRDPSPQTKENEFKDEFLRRVQYANENFTVFEPGYKTDRGRIFIKYGEPDEIEKHPFDWGNYPYEIWYYYNERLKFVFVDKTGTGDYELVPSDSPYYISPFK